MKNDSIDESILQSKITFETTTSLPEFPFKLTDQDYQDKIEFIKTSLQEHCHFEKSAVEDKENCRREFNSNFASLQSWFIRVSHKEKLGFVLELLNAFSVVLQRSTNLLIDILGPVPKDFIYAKTQFTLSKYDMTPLDNNRCLTDIPLAEAKTNSISWFLELEEKEQVRVIITLLNLSGSAITFKFYFKAVKYLDRDRKYDSAVIEEKLKSYKFYNQLVRKEEDDSIGFFLADEMPGESLFSAPVSANPNPTEPEKKDLEFQEKSAASSVSSENLPTSWDYKQKLEEWENQFKELLNTSGILNIGKINEDVPPVIDMLQLLPISVNRYIYSFLGTRSRKHMRQVNRYWYKSSMAVHKEEHTRRSLDQTIETLADNLSKHKRSDSDSELKYVNMRIQDEEQDFLSDQENDTRFSDDDTEPLVDKKENKRRISENDYTTEPLVDIEENKRKSPGKDATESHVDIEGSESTPSIHGDDLSSFKYSIQMIPDPNPEYPDMHPKNPYSGKYIISEICSRFDHTRRMTANYYWIATSDKANINLHSMLTGAQTKYQLEGHTGYVTALCFHPSNNILFSGSCDTTIRTWDVYSRKITATYSEHKSLITDLCANENHLASISMDQTLLVFDIETGCMIWQYLFSCCPLVIDIGWKLEIYLGVEDGSVFKTDLDQTQSTTTDPKEWEITYAHEERITCILFDEPFVVTGGNDGFVRVWHFEHFDASALATFDHDGMSISGIGLSFMKVLTTSLDGILRIWDMYNSRLIRQIVVNIAKTPIISMICIEIYDHAKIIINNEDSIKVIEFPFSWINFNRACMTLKNEEPRESKIRNTKTPGRAFLASKPQLKIATKDNLKKRCHERLLLANAALPEVVKPSKGDKVTLKEVPIFSKALPNYGFLLFPRTIPGTQKKVPFGAKRKISECNTKVLNTLWKHLPRSTKGFLHIYNRSKKTF